MEYKIGDVAKMFGTSSEGIRFFEKKGLIKSTRTSGDYRVYTKRDIFMLANCLMYSKLGFTLSQAKELFFSESISAVSALFENRIREKEKTLQQEAVMLDCLKERKAALDQAILNEGRIILERAPGVYFYKSGMPINETDFDDKKYHHSVLKMYPTAFNGLFFRKMPDGTYPSFGEKCCFLNEDYAKRLEVELPADVLYCPSSVCATQIINIGEVNAAEYNYAEEILQMMTKEGLRPAGDMQVWYLFFSFKDNREQRYCKIRIPVASQTGRSFIK